MKKEISEIINRNFRGCGYCQEFHQEAAKEINKIALKHLEALTCKIEEQHVYGFHDVLEEYLKENKLK